MIRITCVQLSALKRSLGKKGCVHIRRGQLPHSWKSHVYLQLDQTNDNMPIQTFSFCLVTVVLSLVATLVCFNEKGKVEEV